MQTFEVDGKTYEIAYTIRRVEMYENGRKPIMSSFAQNGGTFSIGELKALAAYGMRLEGGGYVAPKQGMEMAEDLITANGYMPVYETVATALARDCGFFFKAESKDEEA